MPTCLKYRVAITLKPTGFGVKRPTFGNFLVYLVQVRYSVTHPVPRYVNFMVFSYDTPIRHSFVSDSVRLNVSILNNLIPPEVNGLARQRCGLVSDEQKGAYYRTLVSLPLFWMVIIGKNPNGKRMAMTSSTFTTPLNRPVCSSAN